MPAHSIVPHGLLVDGSPANCCVGVFKNKCMATIGYNAPKGWSLLSGTKTFRCSGYNNSQHRGKHVMAKGTWLQPDEWMPRGALLRCQDKVDVTFTAAAVKHIPEFTQLVASPARGLVQQVKPDPSLMLPNTFEIYFSDSALTLNLEGLAFDCGRKVWCLTRPPEYEIIAEIKQLPRTPSSTHTETIRPTPLVKVAPAGFGSPPQAIAMAYGPQSADYAAVETMPPRDDQSQALSQVSLTDLWRELERRVEGQPHSMDAVRLLRNALRNDGLITLPHEAEGVAAPFAPNVPTAVPTAQEVYHYAPQPPAQPQHYQYPQQPQQQWFVHLPTQPGVNGAPQGYDAAVGLLNLPQGAEGAAAQMMYAMAPNDPQQPQQSQLWLVPVPPHSEAAPVQPEGHEAVVGDEAIVGHEAVFDDACASPPTSGAMHPAMAQQAEANHLPPMASAPLPNDAAAAPQPQADLVLAAPAHTARAHDANQLADGSQPGASPLPEAQALDPSSLKRKRGDDGAQTARPDADE